MSNKNIISLLILLLTFVGLSLKAQQTQLLDSAAQQYSNNNFEKAITTYETILENGYESAELYYNLGNAYYKSNKIPFAILNYERAKKLSTSDEDIEFNLRLANTHVVDKIETLPTFFLTSWWNTLVQLLSSNQWAAISITAFILGLTGFLIFFLYRITIVRQISFWIGVILIIASVFTFNFSRKQYWLSKNQPTAIIITPSIVVKSSPANSGTDLFLIHEGMKVTVTDRLDKWIEIKLPDGNEGWIKDIDLVVI